MASKETQETFAVTSYLANLMLLLFSQTKTKKIAMDASECYQDSYKNFKAAHPSLKGFGFLYIASPQQVISGFRALRRAGAPKPELEPATEGSLQISGRTHKPLCHRRPQTLSSLLENLHNFQTWLPPS
ncbi:hypothetical protein PoB_003201900 [Plakobranchus ocellatus]|uniref:Uncharacterized protein n=1 Tax=Plakobranchus ocellatus TaxID=259542 RepID=A0AAV4AGG6_9GAST|nr:hypothetical protein PoB_003201900 [Plakobranchus ocellatus]